MVIYMNNKEYLREKCFEGLEKRGFIEDFEYVKRLNYELDVIYSGDLESFSLIQLILFASLNHKESSLIEEEGPPQEVLFVIVFVLPKLTQLNII